MGHFQLFSMILKFSMGHFLSFYTDFYGPFSNLMGLWRMAPCLPNHWNLQARIQEFSSGGSNFPKNFDKPNKKKRGGGGEGREPVSFLLLYSQNLRNS